MTKRKLTGKNKDRAGIQGSLPRMFSKSLQLWNFRGQRLGKFTADSKMMRYSPQTSGFQLQAALKFHVASRTISFYIKSACLWYPLEKVNRNQLVTVTSSLSYLTSAISFPAQLGCSSDGAFWYLWSSCKFLMLKFCTKLLR